MKVARVVAPILAASCWLAACPGLDGKFRDAASGGGNGESLALAGGGTNVPTGSAGNGNAPIGAGGGAPSTQAGAGGAFWGVNWSVGFPGVVSKKTIAIASNGSTTVFAAWHQGIFSFGGKDLAGNGASSFSLVKLDSLGGHVWSKPFSNASLVAIAIDDAGDILLAGSCSGTTDLGGGALADGGAFVAKLDSSGNHLWANAFGSGKAVGVSANAKQIVVSGYFTGTADFGKGPNFPNGDKHQSAGNRDAFVATFNASGDHGWSACFGGSSNEEASAVALDASGNVVLVGSFKDTIGFGGPVLQAKGASNLFVAKLTASGGHMWSKAFGAANSTISADAMTLDHFGNVVVSGSFGGDVDFGGPAPLGANADDLFVVKLAAAGEHLWSGHVASSSKQPDAGVGIAVDHDNNVVLTGAFDGSVDFGGSILSSMGGKDVFVSKRAAAGAHVWSKRFGNELDQVGRAVASDGAGGIILLGEYKGAIDFGVGALKGSDGIYVTKLTL